MAFLHLPSSGDALGPPDLARVPLASFCTSPPQEEVEDGLGGTSNLGKPVEPRNQLARRGVQNRIRVAVGKVADETRKQVQLGRLTLLGLLLLQTTRVGDFLVGGGCSADGGPLFAIQFLCVSSDMGCLLLMSPLFLQRVGGHSPMFEYIGPMLTGLAALTIVDTAAFLTFMVLGLRMPVSPGSLRSSQLARVTDAIFANLGVWELTLICSVCLQVALCACSWRIYVAVREAGLYPPGDPARELSKVSVLEVFCDEPEGAPLCEFCGAEPEIKQAAETVSPRGEQHDASAMWTVPRRDESTREATSR